MSPWETLVEYLATASILATPSVLLSTPPSLPTSLSLLLPTHTNTRDSKGDPNPSHFPEPPHTPQSIFSTHFHSPKHPYKHNPQPPHNPNNHANRGQYHLKTHTCTHYFTHISTNHWRTEGMCKPSNNISMQTKMS